MNFKEYADYVLRDPVIFGDYKNTLEESEPRLYEDIQDFEAAKALFQEVRRAGYHNTSAASLHLCEGG